MHQYLLPDPLFLFFRSRLQQKFSTFVPLCKPKNVRIIVRLQYTKNPETEEQKKHAAKAGSHRSSSGFTPSQPSHLVRPRRFTMLQCRETRWATPSRLVLLFIAASKTGDGSKQETETKERHAIEVIPYLGFDRSSTFSIHQRLGELP